MNVECSLVEEFPQYLDMYKPLKPTEDPDLSDDVPRSPDPPRWLIMTTQNDRGNLFKVKKYVNQKNWTSQKTRHHSFWLEQLPSSCKVRWAGSNAVESKTGSRKYNKGN